jgi:transketolase
VAERSQRDAFWSRVYDCARADRDIVVVTADMGAPALDAFRSDVPAQFINVGIAEQNAVSVGTGLALAGKKVFVYAIAPFITLRCLEQIRVGQGIMGIPLSVVGVGAGFSYEESGPTHHLVEDLAVMRAIPGLTVHSVSDAVMAADVAGRCCRQPSARYVRLDRQALPKLHAVGTAFPDGVTLLREGRDAIIASTGVMAHTALAVAERLEASGVSVGVLDVHTFPIDEPAFLRRIAGTSRLVSLEEHVLPGGLGSAIAEIIADRGLPVRLRRLGVPAGRAYGYIYGGRELIRRSCGLDPKSVERAVSEHLAGT